MTEAAVVTECSAVDLVRYMIRSGRAFSGECIRRAAVDAYQQMTGSTTPPASSLVDKAGRLLSSRRLIIDQTVGLGLAAPTYTVRWRNPHLQH